MLSAALIKTLTTAILGADYDLSLAYVPPAKMREFNRRYRHHDRTTNILSFPFDAHSGEIILNRQQLRAEAAAQGRTLREYSAYLLIHGLLHLSGLTHGSKMERKERQLAKLFAHLWQEPLSRD